MMQTGTLGSESPGRFLDHAEAAVEDDQFDGLEAGLFPVVVTVRAM